MKLNRITLKDKPLFLRYLNKGAHHLSVYAFQNIYIWNTLFEIRWALVRDSLCIFFRDRTGCFLYLPPLSRRLTQATLSDAFKVMDSYNPNRSISRVENVEEANLEQYQAWGFRITYKSSDYLCNRAEMVSLRGNRFKSKRWCTNYFSRHYEFEYLRFSRHYAKDCLKLYDLWARQRCGGHQDKVYRGMLSDSRKSLAVLLYNYHSLDIIGRIVKVSDAVKGFTFGFRLNPRVFCILYEVTDLSIKGLAQFIFRALSAEAAGYTYINIMDDSGLENLKTVKASYHPERLIPAYIATQA